MAVGIGFAVWLMAGALMHAPALVAQESNAEAVGEILSATLEAHASDSYLRLNELESLFDQSQSIVARCEFLKEMIYLSMDSANPDRLSKYGSLGRALANEAGDDELKIYSDLAFAVLDQVGGDLETARLKIDAVRHFANDIDDDNSLFLIDAIDAIVGMEAGNYLDSVTKLTTSTLTLPDTQRGNWMRMLAYLTLGYTYTGTGDVNHMVIYYGEAIELSKREGIAFDRESLLYNMATALRETRQFDLAAQYFEAVREIANQNGNIDALYYNYEGLAWLKYAQLDYTGTLENIDKATSYAGGDPVTQAHLFDLAAISHAQLGNVEVAKSFLQQSQDLFSSIEYYEDPSDFTVLAQSYILKAEGKTEEAFNLLDRARRQQVDRQSNNFTYTVSHFHNSLDSMLARQKAELELARVRSTNANLILVFSVLFIVMLIGALFMQNRHTRELVQSRIHAEQANKAKSEFLANMSHELRTPLNAILGFSEIMTHKIFGDMGARQYDDYAKHINQSGKLLLDIINDILDLSKVESGQLQLNSEFLDLEILLSDTCALVQNRAHGDDIELETDIAEHARYLLADRRLTKQILLNLLSNAVKFTPPGGKISLKSEKGPSGELILRVADDGVGMSAQELSLALTPFGQAGTTLTRSHEGTGLGLPLSNTLMELHDGKLEVTSEKDVGTVVTMVFPANRRLAGPQGQDGVEQVKPGKKPSKRGKQSNPHGSKIPPRSKNNPALT